MAQLEVGAAAPEFELKNQDGIEVSLSDLLQANTAGVVIYFYPQAGTPGCTIEARDFEDSLGAFHQAGYEIVGISPDQVPPIAKFAAEESLEFPLLSDPAHAVLDAYGAWGERMLYGKKVIGVIRSTFAVDKTGTIIAAKYNVKAAGHVGRILKALDIS